MQDFDLVLSRKGTGSVRWDNVEEKFGEPELIPLTTADMDFLVAEPIRETLRHIVDFGIYGYTKHTDAFYAAIIKRFHEKWHWDIKREWIVHSPTIVAAIAYCIQSMTEPGDGVVLPTPMYHPFQHLIRDNGRTLLECPMVFVNGRYALDFDDLEKKIAAAKMLIFCNPHNPAGTAWTQEELYHVCKLCEAHDVVLISDEIHCDFIYSGREFVSMSTAAEAVGKTAMENLIVCSSAGKSFNIAGLQVSNIIIPGEKLRKSYQSVMTCQGFHELNMMGTAALQVAYTKCDDWLVEAVRYLEGNRDYVVSFCKANIPEIIPVVPEATYMIWLDCRKLHMTEKELEDFFIHKAKVAVNIGGTFGSSGEGYVRLNFATPRSVLERALQSIAKAVDQVLDKESFEK